MRVLIIDDHPDTAASISAYLTLRGHTCRTSRTGHDGLAASREEAFDLVLLDVGLPDLSGYEVARAIRAANKRVHIAAVTGWGQTQDRIKALAAGFDQHVTKPVDGGMLDDITARAAKRFSDE